MNLHEQLTAPDREKLDKEVEKYPSTGKLIMYSLEHNSSVLGLTIRQSMDIHTIFHPFEPFSVDNLFKLFA